MLYWDRNREHEADFDVEVPKHEFLVNFRSPLACVSRLNTFRYEMHCASQVKDGLRVVRANDGHSKTGHERRSFLRTPPCRRLVAV